MTDFFADLEAELRTAAHRRAGRARRRPRTAAFLAPLAAAAACVAVLAVAFGGSGSPDDRPAPAPALAPPPAPACAPARRGFRAPAGVPPQRVLRAVPALPREPVGGPLSEAATRALAALDPAAVYVDTVVTLDAGHGVSVSAVPVRGARRPCRAVRPAGWTAFRGYGACLLASRGSELIATLCQDVAAIRRAPIASRRLDGMTLVLGFGGSHDGPVPFLTAGGGRGLVVSRDGVRAATVADRDQAKFSPGEPILRERDTGSPVPAGVTRRDPG